MDKKLVENENLNGMNEDFDDLPRKRIRNGLFKIPKALKKTFIITTSLFLVGIILFILGVVFLAIFQVQLSSLYVTVD